MNKLKILQEQFKRGELSKHEFINEALLVHQFLFDYVEIIKNIEVTKILISAQGISFFLEDDIQLVVPPNESRTAPIEIMNFGSYELNETKIIDILLVGSRHILDIGANIGWYSVRFARQEPNAKIYCFEPVPLTYEFLCRNVNLNNVGEQVLCYNYGLSNTNGSCEFFIAPTNCVNASLLNVANVDNAQAMIGLTLTLDQWKINHKVKPDFIKCDVEGAELLVFQGGYETLANDKPIVFTELLRKWTKPFNYHPNDVLAYFRELNYCCYAIGPESTNLIEKVTEETLETNYVFLHSANHSHLIDVLNKIK